MLQLDISVLASYLQEQVIISYEIINKISLANSLPLNDHHSCLLWE